jgi:MFS family permease
MTRDLFLMAASLFTWGIGEGMFLYFQPIYLEKLGASPVAIGGILGAIGMIMAFTQLPAGYLADRFGRRPLIWVSWVTGCIATLLMAVASSLNIFIVGILLYGFTGFVMPPMNSYITHARGKWSVARALTFGSAAYNLGAVAGPVIGGRLAEAFSLKMIYSVAAVIFVVSTIIIFFISRQPVEVHPDQEPRSQLLKNSRFLVLLGMISFTIFATYLPQPLAPNFLQNERGISLSTIGILGSLGCLGNALLVFTLGRLKTRWGYLVGQLAVLSFSVILWLNTGLPWFMVGYFLLGGFKAIRALSLALVRTLIHGSHMGTAYGMIDTASSIAIILSPALAGLLYQGNPSLIFSTSTVLIVISILVALWIIPRHTEQAADTRVVADARLDEIPEN